MLVIIIVIVQHREKQICNVDDSYNKLTLPIWMFLSEVLSKYSHKTRNEQKPHNISH